MVLSEFLGAIGRRWYVALVGLVLTFAMAYGAMSLKPAEYAGRGLVVLLPSQESVGQGGNPFLGLDGLDLPARVVVAYFTSPSEQAEIAKAAPGATVEVSIEESTRGPVIAVDASAPTSEVVLNALRFVTGAIPAALTHLQEEVDAPKASQIRSEPLTMDTQPKLDRKKTIRLVIFAAVLGLAATGFLTFSIDGMVRRRAAMRRPAAAEPDDDDGDGEIAEIAEIAEIGDHRPPRSEKAARKRG